MRRHDFSILTLYPPGILEDQAKAVKEPPEYEYFDQELDKWIYRDPPEIPNDQTEAVKESHRFSTFDELLEFVTKDWRKGWVIMDIRNQAMLESLSKRPWFLLVNVDAPLGLRWTRFKKRCESLGKTVPTLEAFVGDNDKQLYGPESGLASLMGHADVHLINSSDSLLTLHTGLDKLNLTNEERFRPSWDQYFMQLASLAARRSNCMKRRVGCVLVREKRVISTGYNGTPRNLKNCNEGGCSRCNGGQGSGVGLSTCLCLHAEENALLEAGRERIREGSTLYCDT